MEPGSTKVMEPIFSQWSHNLPGFIYQVKWDGLRMLSFINKGNVILQNRRGRIKTDSFPELYCLGNVNFQPLVLDGEIISIREGKADFSMVLRRNFSSRPGQGAPPINYVVFDILCFQGRDIRGKPLSQRQGFLNQIELEGKYVSVIDNFQDGERLYTDTKERHWEGIVGKDISSCYMAGKSAAWRKYKHRKTEVFFIIGYVLKMDRLASILVGKDFGDGLVSVGAVGSGLSNNARKELLIALRQLETRESVAGKKKKPDNWHWIKPLLEAKVEYMEWTESLTLRAPVFKSLILEGREFELS